MCKTVIAKYYFKIIKWIVGKLKQLGWLGPDELSLVGPTGVQLLDFCCSSVSELVCCLVLVLFHLSKES